MIFPFDTIATAINSEPKFLQGMVYSMPADLSGISKIQQYSKFQKPGRYQIDYGYAALVLKAPDETVYCFPGLIPEDREFRNRFNVSENLKIGNVERFINSCFKESLQERMRMRDEFLLVLHDLRSISATVSAIAAEAKIVNEQGGVPQHLLESLVSTQYLLKLRQDSLDFDIETTQGEGLIDTAVFRKVDRVCRSFMTIAQKRKILIRYTGESYSTARVPSGFEFVPFIIMDNAVKYSPNNATIIVDFREEGEFIFFDVSSIGPNIQGQEQENIFLKGVRGKAALEGGYNGTGLGLYTCRRILDRCRGVIDVTIGSNDIPTSKGICRDIKFSVKLPLSLKKLS